MSVSRRSFAHATPISLSELPSLGIAPSLVAAIELEFCEDEAGNVVSGLDPDRDGLPPSHASGPFLYDWSDADERGRFR